jgi:hypothetical protein
MVRPLGAKSDAGSVHEPQPAALRLLGGNFQPLAPPDPFDPFVVDDLAGGRSQKLRDLPIAVAAILAGDLRTRNIFFAASSACLWDGTMIT